MYVCMCVSAGTCVYVCVCVCSSVCMREHAFCVHANVHVQVCIVSFPPCILVGTLYLSRLEGIEDMK